MPGPRRRVTPVSVTVPGRARLRVEGLRGYPGLAHRIEESLATALDVHRVQPTPVTGTVLILFEPRRVRVRDLISRLRRAWQTHAGAGPHRVEPAPPWVQEAPWHVLSRASVIRRLQSSPITGLPTADARARLAWLGPNRVPAVPGKGTGQIVLEQLSPGGSLKIEWPLKAIQAAQSSAAALVSVPGWYPLWVGFPVPE